MVSKPTSIAAYRKRVPKDLLTEIDLLFLNTTNHVNLDADDPRLMIQTVRERVMYLNRLEVLLKKQVDACKSILDGLWTSKK